MKSLDFYYHNPSGFCFSYANPGGGGGPWNMIGVEMFIVSLRGVNFEFWSHLGCSGLNAIIFSCEGLV